MASDALKGLSALKLALMARQVVNEHFHVYNLSATSRIPAELIPKVTLSQARHIAGCAMN